jgi:hypothetical protein
VVAGEDEIRAAYEQVVTRGGGTAGSGSGGA